MNSNVWLNLNFAFLTHQGKASNEMLTKSYKGVWIILESTKNYGIQTYYEKL